MDTTLSGKKRPIPYLFSKIVTQGVGVLTEWQHKRMAKRYWKKLMNKSMKDLCYGLYEINSDCSPHNQPDHIHFYYNDDYNYVR